MALKQSALMSLATKDCGIAYTMWSRPQADQNYEYTYTDYLVNLHSIKLYFPGGWLRTNK